MPFNCDENIILENERARLEPLEEKHIQLLAYVSKENPSLIQYSPSKFSTEDDFENYIKDAIAGRKNCQRYAFAIYDKEAKGFAGSTSFGAISNKDLRLEIGWTWLAPEFQGSGLNKAIKSLMLDYAFKDLEFERVQFKIDARNKQSRRAVEKLGAIFEAELRSHTVMVDGFRRNTVIYSILKNEYKKL